MEGARMNYQELLDSFDEGTRERLLFLSQLIASGHERLDHLIYSPEGKLLASNAGDEHILDLLFSGGSLGRRAMDYGREHTMPYILSSALGNLYAVVYRRSHEKMSAFHVLGPVFTDAVSDKQLSKAIAAYNLPPAFAPRFARAVREFPVIPWQDFGSYVIMLHYAVNKERIERSDFAYMPKAAELLSEPADPLREIEKAAESQSRPWMAEQALLNNVREGNLDFRSALSYAGMVSSGVKVDVGEPMKKIQVSSCIFVALCARAAIEGGLPPQTAYDLQNLYSQSILSTQEISQIADINHHMYEDFIRRVHKLKQLPGLSPQVRKCMDYIEMHPYDKISISELAASAGYTDYYLSRKFKKEAGCSLHDYILKQKMACAGNLLTVTDLSVQEVSDRLHFCSRSYFTDNFCKFFGVSPTEYRREHRKV